MKEIKFNYSNPPELLLDIDLNGEIVDIHNDFDCTNIEVNKTLLIITLEKNNSSINYIPNTKIDRIIITFKKFESNSINALLMQKIPATIDNFSIGKMISKRMSKDEKALFILGFVDSQEFEIVASEAIVSFS